MEAESLVSCPACKALWGQEIRPQDGNLSGEGGTLCEAPLMEDRASPLGFLKFVLLDIHEERVRIPNQDYRLQSLSAIVW